MYYNMLEETFGKTVAGIVVKRLQKSRIYIQRSRSINAKDERL